MDQLVVTNSALMVTSLGMLTGNVENVVPRIAWFARLRLVVGLACLASSEEGQPALTLAQ